MRTRKHLDLNPLVDLAQFLAIFEERASIIPQPGTGHGLQGHAACGGAAAVFTALL